AGIEAPSRAWAAPEVAKKKRQVLLLWLAGGASQLETWDPKPGRPTGGPFKAIPTSVPGVHVCELMPRMAKLMHKVGVVRSLDTRIGDHGQAADVMQRGRKNEASVEYPDFGTVVAKELSQRDAGVPEYVSMYLATEGQRSGKPYPGFLGARHSAITLERSLKPENIDLPQGLTEKDQVEQEHLRQYLTERFNRARQADAVDGYNSSYARVR